MSRPKRLVLAGLAFLILAALLVRSILTDPRWRAFDSQAFLNDLLSVDKSWMGWALLSIYLTYVVRSLRWKALVRQMRPEASLWNLIVATVVGFAAIGLFGRAGEMVRPVLIARKEKVSISSQVAIWFIERAFDTITVLICVAFALRSFEAAGLSSSPALTRALHTSGSLVGYSTLGVAALLVALRNTSDKAAEWLLRRLRFLPQRQFEKVEHSLRAFVEGLRGLRRLDTLLGCIFYSVLEWGLIAFCYNSVFNAFSGGMRLGVSELLIFMGCVMGGSMIQIPGLGGGTQVASLLVLTDVLGVQPEVAASISLLIWVFTFLVVIPPALVLAFFEGLSWGKLKRLESES